MTFSLPSGLIADYQEMADVFINDLGRDCVLIYPKKEACANCYTDTITGRSSGVYKAGGPTQFPAGSICPWCNGDGFFITETTETLKMRVYWNPRQFLYPSQSMKEAAPGSVCEIRAYLTDFTKLSRCQFLKPNDVVNNFFSARFTRVGEMVPYGLGEDHYIVGYWKKET